MVDGGRMASRRLIAVAVVAAAPRGASCCAGVARRVPGTGAAAIGACPMFPADSYWHANVASLPLDPSSAAWTATIGTSSHVHADFGSGTVGRRTDRHPVHHGRRRPATGPRLVRLRRRERSRAVPDPVRRPDRGRAGVDGDRHVLVVDNSDCHLYEMYAAYPAERRAWQTRLGRRLRPALQRPAAGRLDVGRRRRPADPARAGPLRRGGRRPHRPRDPLHRADHPVDLHLARPPPGRLDHRARRLPPMGAWFRLRPDFDTSRFTGAARVIADAMKQHGIILADNGSSWYMSGSPDERWDNDELHQLDVITGADFQAVDSGR